MIVPNHQWIADCINIQSFDILSIFQLTGYRNRLYRSYTDKESFKTVMESDIPHAAVLELNETTKQLTVGLLGAEVKHEHIISFSTSQIST